jgi:hypothetical protein
LLPWLFVAAVAAAVDPVAAAVPLPSILLPPPSRSVTHHVVVAGG